MGRGQTFVLSPQVAWGQAFVLYKVGWGQAFVISLHATSGVGSDLRSFATGAVGSGLRSSPTEKKKAWPLLEKRRPDPFQTLIVRESRPSP